MAGILPGDSSHNDIVERSSYARAKLDKNDLIGSSWYLSRKEIEENSPSRKDGIYTKKESYLRKSYCTFLQDLGMRLKVPQVTIATAVVFCHRFFLRQCHGKNDHRTISTVCMFLAGKIEESPRPLKDVILVSYEIIHKKDPAAIRRIKQKEVYEQQKELILLAERVVLTTLAFDFNVQHPYKPLIEAIKKFKVTENAQNALAQVGWNFVNDGLRTSLCLQFKPHQIAAGAIFLAARFLKVKIPSDGGKVWWQEFNVTPRQLKEISNQLLELYEQNRAMTPSHGHETQVSSASTVVTHETPLKASSSAGEPSSRNQSHDCTQNDKNDQEDNSKDICKEKALKEHANIEPENETVTSSQVRDKSYSSPLDAIKKIDKDKVKAALERRRKERGEVMRKMDVLDDDDLIERELESGNELAARGEMVKKQETNHDRESIVDEGELHSPQEPVGGKRKGGHDNNRYHESVPAKHRDGSSTDIIMAFGRIEWTERDLKKQRQQNHSIDA